MDFQELILAFPFTSRISHQPAAMQGQAGETKRFLSPQQRPQPVPRAMEQARDAGRKGLRQPTPAHASLCLLGPLLGGWATVFLSRAPLQTDVGHPNCVRHTLTPTTPSREFKQRKADLWGFTLLQINKIDLFSLVK